MAEKPKLSGSGQKALKMTELTRKLIERRIANNNEGIAAMDRDGISNDLKRELYDGWKQDNAIYTLALVGLSVQPAPTGWKLVPEELPAENNKKAVKLALSATVLNWPDYMNSLYRVMIGSVK